MSTIKSGKIYISGGTGSAGQALIDFFLKKKKVTEIRILSRNEYLQWQVKKKFNSKKIKFFLGDVRDREKLIETTFGVDIVIHAAALKHIDMCEENPDEAIKTNVLGTLNIAYACRQNNVSCAINLSSDKAPYATSVYGATKLLAEKIFILANAKGKTKFYNIRYGNVISSHGSVFEIFNKKIKFGENLEIFSQNMERYFVSQNQVIDLLAWTITHAKGGEIFLLLPGKVKIVKLAENMIKIARSKSKIICGKEMRLGEKESAFLATSEEQNCLYKIKNNWFVITPEDYQRPPIFKKIKPFLWQKYMEKYLLGSEIKTLIINGQKELE